MRPTSLGPKIVAVFLSAVLASAAFAQPPRSTRVCAIEDATRVESPDAPGTSRTLTPCSCIDCQAGVGCGDPFEQKRKTKVCAIEDETRVESPDAPGASETLRPGYCIECSPCGCGVPFLAAPLSGSAAAAAGFVGIAGGILGGLAGAGVFGGGGGSKGPPGGGIPPPGIPPPFPIPGGPPIPLPTQVPVSPFQ